MTTDFKLFGDTSHGVTKRLLRLRFGRRHIYSKNGKYRFGSLITAIPAMFMTAVSVTYILPAKEGLCLDQTVSYIIGAIAAIAAICIYCIFLFRSRLKNKGE